MPDPDIHDRLIARLEDERARFAQWSTHLIPGREIILAAFDAWINDVRRKCPRCGDKGVISSVHDQRGEPLITVRCICNRPALLAEWERRLGGKE